jgi:CTP:molybdopterin cytidylyltransferase MocA
MKIEMIYLAAGNSRRFGSNKLCHPVAGIPMYRYGLDALETVLQMREACGLTVVTETREISENVKMRAACREGRMRLCGSPEREKGISYSIRAGLAAAGEADYYLFSVADQPWIRPDTILELIDQVTEGEYAGGYVSWKEQSGNPAIFSRLFLPDLYALTGDTGGKKLLLGRPDICAVRAGEEAELKDIDEPGQII